MVISIWQDDTKDESTHTYSVNFTTERLKNFKVITFFEHVSLIANNILWKLRFFAMLLITLFT